MTFTAETIASVIITGILAVFIPLAAIIFYKLKNKDTWIISALIGAGTFLVFAMVLEQILHTVMVPLVSGSVLAYCIYAPLAAGIFEETGRFVSYKLFMKKRASLHNAVMMGLGHGGFEVIAILGIGMLNNLVLIFTASSGNYPAEQAQLINSAASAISQIGFSTAMLSIYERILAMALHVCLSVIVFNGAFGKIWLYPAAIILHALFDLFAALYQTGVITSMPLLYGLLTVMLVLAITFAVMTSKSKTGSDAKII